MTLKAFAALVLSSNEEDESKILLIIQCDVEGVFLFSYANDIFLGDTWHENTEDAMDQANYQFSVSPKEWIEIPDTIIDHKGTRAPVYSFINAHRDRS